MMAINTIATHPRDDSVEIFRNSVALVLASVARRSLSGF